MTTADLPPDDAPSGFDYKPPDNEPESGPPNLGDLLVRVTHDGYYHFRIIDGTERPSDVPDAGWTFGGRLSDEAREKYLPGAIPEWVATVPTETVVHDGPVVFVPPPDPEFVRCPFCSYILPPGSIIGAGS